MKRLFSLVFVLAIILVAVGFYRGWFTVSSPAAGNGSNKVELNLTVDKDKIKDDANAVKEKAIDLTGGAKDDAKADAKDDAKDDGVKADPKDGVKDDQGIVPK